MKSAVGVAFEIRQHRRVDQVALQRVGVEQARRQGVERQRPERMDRRQLARREAQRISLVRPVELRALGVDR